MPRLNRSNLALGLAVAGFALAVLLVWIPADTDTGLIEHVRRRVMIGDALAPSVAAVFVLLGGLLVAVERKAPPLPDARRLGFTAGLALLMVASLLVMRWAGPVAVALSNAVTGEGLEYRLLRDTSGWKHIGFVLGGTLMVAGLIAAIEGRVRLKVVAIALLAVLAMIAVYDLPFDDLLLPPNGDV